VTGPTSRSTTFDTDFHTHKIAECHVLAERARDATERAVYLAMADEFAQRARTRGAQVTPDAAHSRNALRKVPPGFSFCL
jgi:hypothetical protein